MRRLALLAFVLVALPPARAVDPRPIVLDPTYEHDKFVTKPMEIERKFRAFTVSFDSADNDDGDEVPDVWGIPQWVAYQIKSSPPLAKAPDRPPEWMTDPVLHEVKIAPADATYHFSLEWRQQNPNSKFLGYDRGHLCMKHIAWRLGADADWNSHTVLNACPQRAELNQGIWLDLEEKTEKWADKHGSVWVVCGSVIYGRKPLNWLGQSALGEVMIAIPDAFFKIVVREPQGGTGKPLVLAFIYPQRGVEYKDKNPNHVPYLTNVGVIEHFTGLDFLTALPDDVEAEVEKVTATELWPTE